MPRNTRPNPATPPAPPSSTEILARIAELSAQLPAALEREKSPASVRPTGAAPAKRTRERTPYGMMSKAQIRRRDRGEVLGRDLDRRDDARAARRGFGAYGGARSERDDGSHAGTDRGTAFDLVSGSGMPVPGDRDRGW